MQAKDIRDDDFLRAVATAEQLREGAGFVSRWDVAAVLAGDPDSVGGSPVDYAHMPEKVVLAKAKALVRRGLVDACTCGCRGDIELTAAGQSQLAHHAIAPST